MANEPTDGAPAPETSSGIELPEGSLAAEELRHLGRKLLLARLALFWEGLWPALWPAVGLGGLFLALALFDVLPWLPLWLHWLILGGFAAGMVYALWKGARALALPEIAAARRRLERASDLSHRPLLLLRDSLAAGGGDAQSRALWRLHRLRTIERIRALRVGLPEPGLAARDPLALRGALLVVLVIAVTVAWGDGLNRIARALAPGAGGPVKGPAVVDIWITPPAYTGMAPVYLSAGKDTGKPANAEPVLVSARTAPGGITPNEGNKPIAIPEGAAVLAQLSGGWGTPRLEIGGADTAFKPVADGTWKMNGTIAFDADAQRLVVRQGGTRVASWPVHVVADMPPSIKFSDEPGASRRGALRIAYEGSDDYGITKAKLYIRRERLGAKATKNSKGADAKADEAALKALNAPYVIDLALPGNSAKTVKETAYQDLTAHPWAGTEVSVQIVARDGAGQPAVSEPMTVVLPERFFRHPVARALVLLRKRLILDPSSRDDVADQLYNLSTIPGSFDNDTSVFLAIQSMSRTLNYNRGLAVLGEVQQLMWDTALHLEDGRLSLAERRMRELQRKLMEALKNKAPNAEIQKLMRELQQAMSEFLREMMKGMKKMPQMAQPFDPNSRFITPQDLQRMLDRAKELAMTGNLDAARQMLSMLREMLENLRSGRFAQGQGRQQSQAWQMLRELQDLMRRQQELMDKTYRDSQKGEGKQQPHAQTQEELRNRLGELLRKFGEMMRKVPHSLGDAELDMRQALENLKKGRPGDAVENQGKALENMRRGLGEMAQQFARRFGRGKGRGRGRGRGYGGRIPGQPYMAYDPLGRPLPNAGMSTSDDVQIPDEADTQRAREILEELRRRAGELGRPPIEMDYLERLLKQF